MTHTADTHAQSTPTYTELELLEVQEAISKLQSKQTYLKACIYLESLIETTYITNKALAIYNDGNIETKLFDRFDMAIYLGLNMLPKRFSQKARYFRDIDDSEAMPVWSNKAYEAAQTVQKYYNTNIKNQ